MKKALSVILAALMAAMSIPAFAFETETLEGANELPETASVEEAELEGVSQWLKPGLNAFNETTEVEDFDDWTALSDSVINLSGISFGANPDGDPADMKIYMSGTSATSGQRYPYATFGAKMEPGRKYRIMFDSCLPSSSLTNCFWFMHAGAGGNHVWIATPALCGKTDGHYDATVTAPTTTGASDQLNFQLNLYAEETPATHYYYFDNFMIMPYYKVNYLDMNGDVIATEQFLLDEDGDVLTEYAINPDITVEGGAGADGKFYEFAGWSNVNGATETIDAVTLANADVTLYPVLKATEKTYFTADKVLASAAEGTTITITAAEAIEEENWDIDTGYTDIGYEFSGDFKSVTFTAHDYSGEVKVEALFSDGVTASFTVNFVGGSKWVPGLNTFTGTDKAFGFEFPEGDALGNYFTSVKWASDANPVKDSVNPSDNAIRAGQQFDYIHTWASYDPAMEPDRKIVFTYDQLSNVGGYLMNSQPGVQFANLDGSIGKWTHFKYIVSGNPYTNRTDVSPRTLATSWIGIGGASGTYGSWAQVELDPAKKYFYADNFSFVPYYRVNYYGLDGETILYTEYVLPEDNKYTVKTDIIPSGANGFALFGETERITSVDLFYADVDLFAIFDASVVFAVNSETKPATLDGDEFVIPTPAELGFEGADNFILWTTADGSHYYAGESIFADQYTDFIGATFTAYCEDVTTPAMGFSYEGDKTSNSSKYKYNEAIEKDGRSLFHLHQYASTFDSSKGWLYDARAHFFGTFDANVYNVFQYGFMLENAKSVVSAKNKTPLAELDLDNDISSNVSADSIIYFYTGSGGGDYYNGGEHRVGNKIWNFAADGNYQQIEVDMSNPANAPASIPWNMTGKVYGFAIDPCRSSFQNDVYIDYIRVYKGGELFVSYIVDDAEAFRDEGRGAGTGYLLSGKIPEKEGYIFEGWSLEPDGEIVTTIDLTEDAYVFAVFKEIEGETAPTVIDEYGIRYDGEGENAINGLRFKASVTGAQREDLEEYGFIVTTAKKVTNSEDLTFDLKDSTGKKLYVSGAAFNKTEGIDKQYDIDGENIIYTAICTNIPQSEYMTDIIARPYGKYLVAGNKVTIYGDVARHSMLSAAMNIKNNGGAAYEENKDYIDAIYNACI